LFLVFCFFCFCYHKLFSRFFLNPRKQVGFRFLVALGHPLRYFPVLPFCFHRLCFFLGWGFILLFFVFVDLVSTSTNISSIISALLTRFACLALCASWINPTHSKRRFVPQN
jgi:hypothetical protein